MLLTPVAILKLLLLQVLARILQSSTILEHGWSRSVPHGTPNPVHDTVILGKKKGMCAGLAKTLLDGQSDPRFVQGLSRATDCKVRDVSMSLSW